MKDEVTMKDKVKITHTLLNKPENELTDEELAEVRAYRQSMELRNRRIDETTKRIVEECKMLCSGYEKGPIPDYGWINPVEKLCYAIEGLNYDYKKYGLQVVLDQAKEKYGGLRFYTHIDSRETGLIGFIVRPLDFILKKMAKVDYGYRCIEDKPPYKTLEWRETTRERFEKRLDFIDEPLDKFGETVVVLGSKAEAPDAMDVDRNKKVLLVEENGKYLVSYILHHGAKTHVEFTKHRFLRGVMEFIRKTSLLAGKFYREPVIQRVKVHELDDKVYELTRKAEHECEGLCQHCGINFGDYYQKCETQGWYMYVCEECADVSGMKYIRLSDGKHFVEGKEVEPAKGQTNEGADADAQS